MKFRLLYINEWKSDSSAVIYDQKKNQTPVHVIFSYGLFAFSATLLIFFSASAGTRGIGIYLLRVSSLNG